MLYAVAQAVIGFLARFFFRLRVFGHDCIPKKGGVLIASNHVSYLDIPLLGCAMERKANFIGKVELLRNPVMAFLFRYLNGIPIRRGGVNRKVLQDVADRLKNGEVVVIYPEGGINTGEFKKLKPGIGMLVAMTGVPVVPALIKGTEKALPVGAKWIRRHPVTVFFGNPIDFESQLNQENGNRKEMYEQISSEVMLGFRQLEKEWEQFKTDQGLEEISWSRQRKV